MPLFQRQALPEREKLLLQHLLMSSIFEQLIWRPALLTFDSNEDMLSSELEVPQQKINEFGKPANER